MSIVVLDIPVTWAGSLPAYVTSAAMLLLPLYASRQAQREKLDTRAMYWGAFAALCGALWGARAFLLLLTDGTRTAPLDWLRFWKGGASSLGALAGATIAGALYARARRLSFAAYADAVAPAALLAYAVARVGCVLNGDDFGIPTAAPWAVRYAPGSFVYADHLRRGWITSGAQASLPVHPWPLYSAAVALVLFALLRRPRAAPAGSRSAIALVGYGSARFILEFLRGDEQRVLGSLVVSQLMCIVIVAIGMVVWLRTRHNVAATTLAVTPAVEAG